MPRFSAIELQEILAAAKAVTRGKTTDGQPPDASPAPTTVGVNYGIRVAMSNATSDTFGFLIYRKTTNDPNTASLIAAVPAGSDHTAVFTDFSALLGVGYYYWVKCVDWSGNISVFSPHSTLTASLTTSHADLGSVLGNDPTDTNVTKNKHVSNAQMKAAADHYAATTGIHGVPGALAANSDLTSHTGSTAVHGVATVVGISESQSISNKTLMNVKANVQAMGVNYNVTDADLAMAGTATMTFFLPAGTTGRVFAFKNIGGVGAVVTITAAGANTIEGAGSITIANGIAAVLCFGNSQWYKLTG